MTLKLGVVGTSWWADAMYLPALKTHPRTEVKRVMGRDAERTQAFAEHWAIPEATTEFDALIDGMDAVVIASANDSHYPYATAALNAGLHVLCEKPLALTVAQADEMARLAYQQNCVTLVPFTYRFMPTARYLKQLIDEGYLGAPYHLNMRYFTGFARDGEYLWRFDTDIAGSGVLGDIGSHFLYLARWFYGEITAVRCTLGYQVPRDPRPDGSAYPVGDDSAMLLLEFENGALGNIHVSALAAEETPFGQIHDMDFHGSEGTLRSFTDWDETQQVFGARAGKGAVKPLSIPSHIWGNARRDTVHNTYKDMFRQEGHMIHAFLDGALDGHPVEPDFADGLAIQRILAAAQTSADEGRRVEV